MRKTQIGRATLYLSDCMDAFNVLHDESIDFILTDPPYECSTTRITKNNDKEWNSDFGEWDRFFTNWVKHAFRVLKQNSGMVIFVPATRFETLTLVCEENGFKYVQPWFWHKSNPAPIIRGGCLQWAVEHMLFVKKGSPKLRTVNNGKSHNIFKYPIPHKRIHKTQKPVELMMELVKLVSDEEQVILDPFNGSGSTGIAATKLSRRYIGFEKDKDNFQKSVNWFNQVTTIFDRGEKDEEGNKRDIASAC